MFCQDIAGGPAFIFRPVQPDFFRTEGTNSMYMYFSDYWRTTIWRVLCNPKNSTLSIVGFPTNWNKTQNTLAEIWLFCQTVFDWRLLASSPRWNLVPPFRQCSRLLPNLAYFGIPSWIGFPLPFVGPYFINLRHDIGMTKILTIGGMPWTEPAMIQENRRYHPVG